MAGATQDKSIWPLSKFQFSVSMNGQVVSFQEVSGLEIEAQVIEYRAGDWKSWSAVKMPGLRKFGNVTLKKGIFVHDNRFWTWFDTIKMNTVARTPMIISLLDQTGKPTMVWTLANAWPTKITGTDLKADGNEVAVESIEVAHEGLTIVNA